MPTYLYDGQYIHFIHPFLPIRSTKSPKASLLEGSLRSGSTVFSAHAVQLLCSLPSGSILGEKGSMRVQLAPQVQEILGQNIGWFGTPSLGTADSMEGRILQVSKRFQKMLCYTHNKFISIPFIANKY